MKTTTSEKWTDWKELRRGRKGEPLHCCDYFGPAVYKIILTRKDFPKNPPIEIGRLGGVDKEGILTIGQTGNLRERLRSFVAGWRNAHAHSAGVLLWIREKSLRPAGKNADFNCAYSFLRAPSNDEDRKRWEKEEIQIYLKKFHEVPPLTCGIPGRAKIVKDLLAEKSDSGQ